MKYYIIKNRKMPWGDYGNTLFEGSLSVMDENYQITEVHKIERTAPYIPEIYATFSRYIVVREDIKDLLLNNNIKGIEKVHPTEFTKLVNIDWQQWDLNAPNPKIYPRGGEPINYIKGRKHNPKFLDLISHSYYSLGLAEQEKIFEIVSDKDDYENYTDIRIKTAEVKYDLFQCGSIIASEKFKNLIETHTDNCLRFIPLQESK